VPFALLQPIAGLPEDELQQMLAELQAAEFLFETRLPPDLGLSRTSAAQPMIVAAAATISRGPSSPDQSLCCPKPCSVCCRSA
jgi:hypothetical protein